jgi:hypothetical protein
MTPALRELIVVALLAGLGCGLAVARGDVFFVAVFGVASAIAIIETIRRSSGRPLWQHGAMNPAGRVRCNMGE